MNDREAARALAKVVTGYGIIWMTGVEKFAQLRPNWEVPEELHVPRILVERLASSWDMWSGEPMPDDCLAMIDDEVLDQFSVAGEPAACGKALRALAEEHPEITGLRLKLPPLTGPTSKSGYEAIFDGIAAAVSRWEP